MKYVYVLEDDPRFQKEIWEAIQAIDPQLQVRFFNALAEFFDWLKDLGNSGPEAIFRGGKKSEFDTAPPGTSEADAQLVAIISKIEFLGPRQLPLMKKTREFFIAKGVCTAEDPTAVVLTTFVASDFNPHELEDRLLNNVILKPFDRLILIQHLTFAIDGRHPASKYTIANQKTDTTIEMVKSIDMMALSEVGFITKSDRAIDHSAGVSKYYSDHFKVELKNSVYAKPWQSLKKENLVENFHCFFHYYGLNPSQIGALRRKIRAEKNDPQWNWNVDPSLQNFKKRPFGVVMIEENDGHAAELADLLRKRIPEVHLTTYKSYISFCEDFDPELLGDEASKTESQPAFPKDVNLTFVFDWTGQILVEVEKSVKDPVQILGIQDATISGNKNLWIQSLTPEMVNVWKDCVANNAQKVIQFQTGLHKFLIRPTFFEKDLAKKQVRIKFYELSPAEKAEFKKGQTKAPKVTDLVLMSHRYMNPENTDKWTAISQSFEKRSAANGDSLKPHLMILTSKDYSDVEMRQFGSFAADIFYRPVDRVYTLQKLKLFFPEINFGKDPVQFQTLKSNSKLYAANPVVINQISEAGLVMQYNRALEPGTFREFILWQAYELAAAKIVGTCNYSEPGSEKGSFNNHFVFFGIGDNFLKSIRIWIRDNYILSKDANAGGG
jgi:hypothetical protein